MAARSDVHRAPFRSGLGEIRGLILFDRAGADQSIPIGEIMVSCEPQAAQK